MRVRAIACLLPLAAAAALCAALMLGGSAAVGCSATPTVPAGGRSVAPLSNYDTWWSEVEQCSGLTGDLSRIAWYQVPCTAGEDGFPCTVEGNGLCGGEWFPPHTIWLGGPNRVLPDGYVDDEWTVKHEMLHDLAGSAAHSDLFKNCHLLLR